jgi:hypothetical protein
VNDGTDRLRLTCPAGTDMLDSCKLHVVPEAPHCLTSAELAVPATAPENVSDCPACVTPAGIGAAALGRGVAAPAGRSLTGRAVEPGEGAPGSGTPEAGEAPAGEAIAGEDGW